jgi:hypothetical protein
VTACGRRRHHHGLGEATVTQQPTPDLVQALARQLRLVETMAWEPAAEPSHVHAEVQEAFRISGPTSLLVMASTAGLRLRRYAGGQDQPASHAQLPRDLLHATATIDDPGLVDACIELIEQQAQGHASDLPAQLVGSGRGEQALIELLSIAMTMAQRVTDTSAAVSDPRQLLAQEAVRSERAWLRRPHD